MAARNQSWLHLLLVLCSILASVAAKTSKLRYIMYLTGQHNVVPESPLVENMTEVALAFMRSDTFNNPTQSEWPIFTTIDEVRPKFANGTIIQVAIGGWGDIDGFSAAAKTEESRKLFAKNVRAMLDTTGADGIDVDWEYAGGNGEDYKQPGHLNSDKAWEIKAYPKLLAEIRAAVGPSKAITAAVPGLPRDMLAFTASTIPSIMASVDYLNIMTYDLFNRRDNVTKHHTGLQLSLEAIDAYLAAGVPPEKANLGLAFYIKWYKTAANSTCSTDPIGCATELMEDPVTGADLGKAGAFSWHDTVPQELSASFNRAMEKGVYDEVGGGHYYWDEEERLFWSWDTPDAIKRKMQIIMTEKGLGGVFAWGLGEDAPKFEHLKASNEMVAALNEERGEQNAIGLKHRSEL
ncbi:glycoside hydrolase family 18 protein [Bipolaris zeicola 26-R-13]|uniref:chitinase n=1 Tax=Cochliobolus carbonum (strain 26-R-13) TaxID=930089 RepID=W6Z2X6_COCC2|nr:glycoside hydrolase family 18 protein [Bipolaris zeicola 26-R-13]EUC38036.1 glycoside hydrolase family 18 protein [Bipolaris zeicola 26-R-13]